MYTLCQKKDLQDGNTTGLVRREATLLLALQSLMKSLFPSLPWGKQYRASI